MVIYNNGFIIHGWNYIIKEQYLICLLLQKQIRNVHWAAQTSADTNKVIYDLYPWCNYQYFCMIYYDV